MNCYRHPTLPAVAQCPDCGKGLCAGCASAYSMPICNVCNRSRINREQGGIITELLLTFGIGTLLAVLFVKWINAGHSYPLIHNILSYVTFIYIFSGIVPGWKTLTRITPRVFLLMPLIGWAIYFLIKFCLSFCIGPVMLPVRTVRNLYRLNSLQKVRT